MKYEYAIQVKDKLIDLLMVQLDCKHVLEDCNYSCSYGLNKNAELKYIKFSSWAYGDVICNDDGVYHDWSYYRKVMEYDGFDSLFKGENND